MASSAGIPLRIQYRVGDATRPEGSGARVIAHVCNDIGAWGAGFVLAVSRRWKAPEQEYRRAFKDGGSLDLGAVQFVEVEAGLTVANMVAQRGIRRKKGGPPPIRYDAVRTALEEVARFSRDHGASVHLPRIGCGLAGGRWEEVEPILQETLVDEGIPVSVYDLDSPSSGPVRRG